METWNKVFFLSVGGAIGTNARYWVGFLLAGRNPPRFPWATLTINVSGSFAIGFLSVILARWWPGQNLRLLILVGFLGGYTTFSTLSLDSWILLENGHLGTAIANITGSFLAGILAVAIGVGLARVAIGPEPEHPVTAISHLDHAISQETIPDDPR